MRDSILRRFKSFIVNQFYPKRFPKNILYLIKGIEIYFQNDILSIEKFLFLILFNS